MQGEGKGRGKESSSRLPPEQEARHQMDLTTWRS